MKTKRTYESFSYDMGWNIRNAFNEGVILGLYHKQIEQFANENNGREVSIRGNEIELNKATRIELLSFIRIFGGTWKKQVEDYQKDKIRYSQEVENPFYEDGKIELKATEAEPPPTCVIEEVEELVPASVRKVRKMRCTPPEVDEVPIEPTPIEDKVPA